ncbi:MAG: CRISPR-associated protein Cas4 [Chloroflexi bacterium]|nr:CRISPR-associated protein Cas4 [Chloroflexota bacterium]
MLDNEQVMFTITDLKQYIYCPRIFYYHSCLPGIRPVTFKMEAGIAVHDDEPKRSLRRKLSDVPGDVLNRHFDFVVQSQSLHLSAKIDEVVETTEGRYPIDYKLARKAGYHFQVQIAAYAMLLEEHFQTHVPTGYLYLIPARKTVEIDISSKLRSAVHRAIDRLHMISTLEHMPEPTQYRQRCSDCEFRRFCNDV